MHTILTNICEGRGKPGDLGLLTELSEAMKDASLCGLGSAAPNPVLSTMRYFHNEYEAHIHDKSCPAGVCKALFQFKVDAQKCNACGACKRNCSYDAVKERGRPCIGLSRRNARSAARATTPASLMQS